jgi:hypothetical protein
VLAQAVFSTLKQPGRTMQPSLFYQLVANRCPKCPAHLVAVPAPAILQVHNSKRLLARSASWDMVCTLAALQKRTSASLLQCLSELKSLHLLAHFGCVSPGMCNCCCSEKKIVAPCPSTCRERLPSCLSPGLQERVQHRPELAVDCIMIPLCSLNSRVV